jgi:arginine repressor
MGGNRSGAGKTKMFDSSRIDILFVLAGDESIYVIPTAELTVKNSISLGREYERFRVQGTEL